MTMSRLKEESCRVFPPQDHGQEFGASQGKEAAFHETTQQLVSSLLLVTSRQIMGQKAYPAIQGIPGQRIFSTRKFAGSPWLTSCHFSSAQSDRSCRDFTAKARKEVTEWIH
jgi:hypothetical protein